MTSLTIYQNITNPAETDSDIQKAFTPKVRHVVSEAEVVNRDYYVVSYRPLSLTSDEAKAALDVIRPTMQPLPDVDILMKLGEIKIKTNSKPEDGMITKATLAVYADEFRRWPADASKEVLSTMHRLESGWWPSMFKVEKELELYAKGRKQLIRALEKASHG